MIQGTSEKKELRRKFTERPLDEVDRRNRPSRPIWNVSWTKLIVEIDQADQAGFRSSRSSVRFASSLCSPMIARTEHGRDRPVIASSLLIKTRAGAFEVVAAGDLRAARPRRTGDRRFACRDAVPSSPVTDHLTTRMRLVVPNETLRGIDRRVLHARQQRD